MELKTITCAFCGYKFKSTVTTRRFCEKACYLASLKTNEYVINNNNAELLVDYTKKGKISVKIDIEDIEKLKKFNWRCLYVRRTNSFYIVASKTIGIHRVIMDCPPNLVVDHINHDTLDNRKCNLRVCTQSTNMQNLKINKNNTSGCTGVCFNKNLKKWRSRLRINRKEISLGLFDKKEDAITARKQAELKYFGVNP